jgi:hypothetical protein
MPSTDTKPELTAKASMAQAVSQPAVYANGLMAITVRQKYVRIDTARMRRTMPLKNCVGREELKDLGVDGRLILKWISIN